MRYSLYLYRPGIYLRACVEPAITGLFYASVWAISQASLGDRDFLCDSIAARGIQESLFIGKCAEPAQYMEV